MYMVQLNFTPKIKVFSMLFERSLPIFTCGFQDAGLGTVGSLNLLLLRTSLKESNKPR